MELIWHGHACFTVRSGEYSVVLDPYTPDMVPGFAPLRLRADQVLCSHGHGDHNYTQAVTLTGKKGDGPFTIHTVASWHDDRQGALRGANTIHVLEAEGLRIAHMGDIGCALDAEQAAQLKKLDALMIPVGGFFTIDAAQAAEMARALGARVIIPMHYRGDGFGLTNPNVGGIDAFLALWPAETVRRYESGSLSLSAGTEPHVAVLAPPLA